MPNDPTKVRMLKSQSGSGPLSYLYVGSVSFFSVCVFLQVKGPGIGLLGISKGGELGLAMASFLKGIKAAVFINGSVTAVGNTINYKDETIPPVSFLRDRIKVTKDGLLDVVEGLQSPLVEMKSFIPVERSDTTFLFLVGQDDRNWKSEFYANEISKRLQAHGKEKPQIILYPEAGHYIEPPYFPLCKAGMHVLVGTNITFGGGRKPGAFTTERAPGARG